MSDTCPKCGSSTVIKLPARALGGAATGGLIGSAVPIIGTGLGSIIGGVVGAVSTIAADNPTYVNTCKDCKNTWNTTKY